MFLLKFHSFSMSLGWDVSSLMFIPIRYVTDGNLIKTV